MSPRFRNCLLSGLAACLSIIASPGNAHAAAAAQSPVAAESPVAESLAAESPVAGGAASRVQAGGGDPASAPASGPAAPVHRETMALGRLAQGDKFILRGMANTQHLEFTVRKDREVTHAELDLVFTPSPALLDRLSHIRVYLNDELMGVAPLDEARPGVRQDHRMALDPRLIGSFNRIRLEFIGHYTDVCEDPAHSSLWLDLSRDTRLVLDQETLPLVNDLAYFPEPFVDLGDMRAQTVPFVFAQAPDPRSLQAAGVLASYFGSVAAWRTVHFPVVYGQVPPHNAVVFADNDHRPGFLQDYPRVDAPTIDMISAPDDPYRKLLLVLGRNPDDLLTAARALAMGGPLLRGQSVEVTEAVALADRIPYDAPRWTPTDRPVRFSELVDYPGQLEVSGLQPPPVALNLNLPPDLFVWRNAGIPMRLHYRYTPPRTRDESRLSLSLNGHFIESYSLEPADDKGRLLKRLPVLENDAATSSEKLLVPAFKIGANNQIRFDFSFGSMVGGAQKDQCQTILPVDMRASIDQDSTIDFSGYLHYLEMPNLKAFAGSGFPFSRMADLSETVVIVPRQPTADQAATVLEALAQISARSGLPAFKVRLTHDWKEAAALDADVLWVGEMPERVRARPDANLVVEGARTAMRQARDPAFLQQPAGREPTLAPRVEMDAVNRVEVVAHAPLAAIVQFQSETHPGRSWVGLLASTPEDFGLLREALGDSGKREAMMGGVVIVRDSGVHSTAVAPRYYAGRLNWWQYVWYHLSDQPVLLVAAALVAILLIAALLWIALRHRARRRLNWDA